MTDNQEEITTEDFKEALSKSGKRIISATRNGVMSLKPFVEMVLRAICFETAFVTDEYRLSDFPLDEVDMKHDEEDLGVPVQLSDYIVDVAKRVRDLHCCDNRFQ